MSKKTKDSSKKTARRATSNYLQCFSINRFQQGRLIDKNDLRATFDSLGKIVSESDLNNMISEAPGPINFTMFLTIFGERIAGTDQEEVIKKAFDTFDPDGAGKINEKKLRKALITWGEKLNNSEVDEAFKEAPIDRDGMIDINSYVKVICGTAVDEE
ncbi:myosin regulatory light chain 2 [Trichonephila inaurata madagascariensis]|uniref:Myosin regulatory light chain 2 n=1 Tax=Trichonephila inaurata madagascariensis TaxID=2747483 RepID=A0A8X6MCM7_9ARAC|nr:myosin regulatory light chain 2 [Trichonephila inaurata madagascariensis]